MAEQLSRLAVGGPSERGAGDVVVDHLRGDVTVRHGFDDHIRGASREDAADQWLRVDYVVAVAADAPGRRLRAGT